MEFFRYQLLQTECLGEKFSQGQKATSVTPQSSFHILAQDNDQREHLTNILPVLKKMKKKMLPPATVPPKIRDTYTYLAISPDIPKHVLSRAKDLNTAAFAERQASHFNRQLVLTVGILSCQLTWSPRAGQHKESSNYYLAAEGPQHTLGFCSSLV
jgi:hypothetical protein